uniref:Uncharacterized protein n=1 Tax=Caenorhabditis tropicalis TaxID=1561998 RepID=A0A1I7V3C3_9PELO
MDRKGSDSSFLTKVRKSSWSPSTEVKPDTMPKKRLDRTAKERKRTKWTTRSIQEVDKQFFFICKFLY